MPTVEELKEWGALEDGKLPKLAWPGGYPIIYYSEEGSEYCVDCANQTDAEPPITLWDIFYEGAPRFCEGCGTEIESAYGDPDEDEEEEPDKGEECTHKNTEPHVARFTGEPSKHCLDCGQYIIDFEEND